MIIPSFAASSRAVTIRATLATTVPETEIQSET